MLMELVSEYIKAVLEQDQKKLDRTLGWTALSIRY